MASDSGKGQQKPAMPAKRLSTAAAAAAAAATPAANNNNNNSSSGGATAEAAAENRKQNNGMTRLTPARDLTLGGRGASKKVFAPNLNAVRNKNANVKTSKDFTQPRGGRRGGRGGAAGATRGRGGAAAGGGNSSLIQTTGVFSEGAGAVHLRKSSSGGSAYARAGEEVAVSRKRTDRKDDKLQDQRVRELIGEASDDDDDEAESDNETELDKTDLTYKPIMLSEGLWHTQKSSIKAETAAIPNLNDKQEDSLGVTQDMQSLSMGLEEPPAQYGRYPRSIGAFLDATQSQIFVMQLPNVLPCVTDDGDDSPATTEQPATSTSTEAANSPAPTTATSNTPKQSVLEQLEEGQIGKILRYKSGRVKLVLGETRFDLDMGLDSGFLQELMSITSNREQRSGDMINLGTIQAKLKATPDWVHLFEQQEAATRLRRQTAAPSGAASS